MYCRFNLLYAGGPLSLHGTLGFNNEGTIHYATWQLCLFVHFSYVRMHLVSCTAQADLHISWL